MELRIQKTSKIIIIFYVILAISFTIAMFQINSTFDTTTLPNILPIPITELEIIKEVEIKKEKIFLVMTDVENFNKILPRNIKSVDIIEHSDNMILAKYKVVESGISSELLVEHGIFPYYEHTMEVMDGDAKGTKIIQEFTDTTSGTIIDTRVNFDLKGILSPFIYLPETNLVHAANTTLTNFIDYSQRSDNETKKIIDDLYREILLRPADKEAFEHWGSLLESGIMTIDEIRIEILNSEEGKSILLFKEMKTVDEINDETKKIIDDLYREILLRPADKEAFEHWGSLLESGKNTKLELRKGILKSQEALSLKTFDEETKYAIQTIFHEVYEIDGMYHELMKSETTTFVVFDPRIDQVEFKKLIDNKEYLVFIEERTIDEIRLEFEELKENGIDFFVDDLELVNEQFLDWKDRFVDNKEFYDETGEFCYSCKWGTPLDNSQNGN